jgi:hypothetical protein
MPSTTAGGLPYPLGTEPVRDGDNAIKNLADAIQLRGGASAVRGASTVTTANASGTGSVGFTGFSASPAVVANSGDSAAGIRIDIVNTVLTGFNYRVLNQTTAAVVPNATVRINWLAYGPSS